MNLPSYRYQVDKDFFIEQFERAGLSQNEVSERLAIDKSSMSRMMGGRRELRFCEAYMLSRLLNVTLETIFDRCGAGRPVAAIAEPRRRSKSAKTRVGRPKS